MSSDYISKSALIKAVHKIRVQDGISEEVGYNRPLTDIANVYECINNQQTVDEKEIIRKAFERVLQMLEEYPHGRQYIDDYGKGFAVAMNIAIEIVKEEYVVNE